MQNINVEKINDNKKILWEFPYHQNNINNKQYLKENYKIKNSFKIDFCNKILYEKKNGEV